MKEQQETASNDLIQIEIQKILVDPKFERNIRGRLGEILHLLDQCLLAQLACDYAEHVVWICENILNQDLSCYDTIHILRKFLVDRAIIEEVSFARDNFFQVRYEVQSLHMGVEVKIATDAAWATNFAIKVCCQRQLENLGTLGKVRYQISTKDVAMQASYAVAHYHGRKDWNSKDTRLKALAKKQGKDASNTETLWQINQILKYVNLPPIDS